MSEQDEKLDLKNVGEVTGGLTDQTNTIPCRFCNKFFPDSIINEHETNCPMRKPGFGGASGGW